MPPKIKPKASCPSSVWELASRQKQRHERDAGDEGEHGVVAGEQAPRRAGVVAMHEVEKSGNHHDLGVGRDALQHEPLGQLVEREDDQREREDATRGFFQNGAGGGHD